MLTQSWLHRITGKEVATPTKQNADQQTGTQDTPADARWEQNSATIYINISNPVLKNATETAISQWNNTKAFTFKIVNNKNANISVSAVNDPNNGAAGLTNTSMNSATGYYLHATVELNSYYLLNPAFGYSQERIVNTRLKLRARSEPCSLGQCGRIGIGLVDIARLHGEHLFFCLPADGAFNA